MDRLEEHRKEFERLKKAARLCPGCGDGVNMRLVAVHVWGRDQVGDVVEIATIHDRGAPYVFHERYAGRIDTTVTFQCDACGRTPVLTIGKTISWLSEGGEALQ